MQHRTPQLEWRVDGHVHRDSIGLLRRFSILHLSKAAISTTRVCDHALYWTEPVNHAKIFWKLLKFIIVLSISDG